jgi:O-antigen/teichoic acid export membrane protein
MLEALNKMFMKTRWPTSALWPDRASLRRRIFGAGFWSLAGTGLSYAITFGSNLILTRLLAPEMFGVMAIATLVITVLTMLSDFGLIQNIIQSSRGSDSAYLNTAWAIQIIRGLLLWVLALCIALFLVAANLVGLLPQGSTYADTYLPYVIAVVSFSIIIDGFQSTKVSEATRYLSLGRITLIRTLGQIVGLICMFGWIFLIGRSIWALVAGTICSRMLTTPLTHIWLPGSTNRWQWDQSSFYEILHFGKWIFLSSILGLFANNADRILLGGFVSSATLGIYSIAALLIGAISQILTTIFAQVCYPALSEVARERPHELKRSMYDIHILTAPFAYFCSGILVVSGNTLIGLLYDSRYAAAGWMLEVLALGLLKIPFNLPQWCLLARGLAKEFTGLVAFQSICTIVLIPLGFHWFGLPGALWGLVASQLLYVPAIIYYQIKYDLLDPSKELILLPAFFAGMIVASGLNFAFGH